MLGRADTNPSTTLRKLGEIETTRRTRKKRSARNTASAPPGDQCNSNNGEIEDVPAAGEKPMKVSEQLKCDLDYEDCQTKCVERQEFPTEVSHRRLGCFEPQNDGVEDNDTKDKSGNKWAFKPLTQFGCGRVV